MMTRRIVAKAWRKVAAAAAAGTMFATGCDTETLTRISIALQAVADYDRQQEDPTLGDVVDAWWESL